MTRRATHPPSLETPALYQAALDILTEALKIHPDRLLLRLGRGLALKDLARYSDAERGLLDCLKLRPGFPLAFDALATVYLHAKRFEDAMRLSDRHRAAFPADYRGHYFGAAAREALEADSESIQLLLAESIRLNPNFAASHALKGKLHLQTGNLETAISSLEQAIRLRPDYSPAVLHLAQAYQKTGRAAEAAEAFQRVRELKEKEQQHAPSLRYHRGPR